MEGTKGMDKSGIDALNQKLAPADRGASSPDSPETNRF